MDPPRLSAFERVVFEFAKPKTVIITTPNIESLERFVQNEPLRRVHECVFGVLALESEPVDPRL